MKQFMDWKTLISIVIGAAITFTASYFFYVESGNDLNRTAAELKVETECLRKLHIATLDALRNVRNPYVAVIPSPDSCGHTVEVSVPGPGATAVAPQAKAQDTE